MLTRVRIGGSISNNGANLLCDLQQLKDLRHLLGKLSLSANLCIQSAGYIVFEDVIGSTNVVQNFRQGKVKGRDGREGGQR